MWRHAQPCVFLNNSGKIRRRRQYKANVSYVRGFLGVKMDIAHLHFLVAEGNAGIRKSVVDMLTQQGATQITEVPDGHTALRCFQDNFTPTVNVAIIDVSLPGMDGLELIRSLAAMNCRARVIIVGSLTNSLLFSIETMAQ